MENNFDLKKFLVENRLTTNSRMVNEEEGHLVSFGYDLRSIEAVVKHLQSKYKEGEDYELHIGRGDDLPNAITIKNPALEKDDDLNDMLNAAQNDSDYEGGFYAPDYLEKKYGAKTAQEIEDDIRNNGGPNDWDYFTSLNSAEEVEDFISDF